jgi:wyosine [tRNA(Phe)-imidazoG37] synthetase (radical SAM superfamily)
MKKTILLLLFVTTPIVLTAQSLFDSLEDLNGVDMVVVTKDAFDLISKFKNIKIEDNEGMKVFEMIQDLEEFKMFSTDDAKVATIMGELVNASIKNQNLTELMRIKDDASRVKIYVKTTKNKDFVSEVLMFVKGLSKKTNKVSEAVIVSLIGSIDINKISELADTF